MGTSPRFWPKSARYSLEEMMGLVVMFNTRPVKMPVAPEFD